MATYSKKCSQVGSFSWASNFTLYVVLTERDVSIANNTSYVDYNVYCQADGSGSLNANHYEYFDIFGQRIKDETIKVNVTGPNAYIPIASGSIGPITHESDGSKVIGFGAEITATAYGVSASLTGNFTLTTIPRYATCNQSLNTKTINTIKMNWSSDNTIDYVWYSKDNGNTWTAVGSVNASSGSYLIPSLSANTAYNIKTRVRRKDSQLTTDSSALSVTTYNKATISSAPDFNHGSTETITYSNPSGSTINISIYNTAGQVAYAGYRACSGSSYTFTFTDTELDALYKAFGTASTLSVNVYLRTSCNGVDYYDYKTITITLKGNQKTIRTKVSSTWRRGKTWTKVSGTWRQAVVWTKVNGTWRRGI